MSATLWEYTSTTIAQSNDTSKLTVSLNALGKRGWELVGITVAGDGFGILQTAILKRPLDRYGEQV